MREQRQLFQGCARVERWESACGEYVARWRMQPLVAPASTLHRRTSCNSDVHRRSVSPRQRRCTMKSDHERFQDLIKEFDTAMLVTRNADDRLEARPMAIADVEETNDLWFIT